MQRIVLFASALALGTATLAQAQVSHGADHTLEPRRLVVSDFNGDAPGTHTPWTATSALDSDVVFSGWDHGPGTQGLSGIDDALGFTVGATSTESDLAEALADGEYLSCVVAPASGATLDLRGARMLFEIERSEWHAPRQYAVFTSVGGFSLGTELFTSPHVESGDFGRKSWFLFFPDAGFGAITGPLEVRIYAFGANFAGHDTSLAAFRLETSIVSHVLDLNTSPGGTAWSEPAGTTFSHGDVVALHALPDAGFRFAGWAGDVTGLGNPRSFKIQSDVTVSATFELVPPPDMSMGINLDWVNEETTAWPLIDLFRRARVWRTRNMDGTRVLDTGHVPMMQTDARGWPTVVPIDPGDGTLHYVQTELATVNEAGTYTLHYEGSGLLQMRIDEGPATTLPTPGGPASFAFDVTPGDLVSFEIRATDPEPNHLRNFRLVHDSFAGTPRSEPFHPLFLQMLDELDPLRFMDWGFTNGSPVVTWADRTRPDHYTQGREEGVSWELVIELCEELGVEPWICVPHMADDDYVTNLAQLFRDELDPSLAVHVEYSNETWNGSPGFTQTDHVRERGLALGLDVDPIVAGHEYTALRSAEIWHIFAEQFGAAAQDRVVNVLATHLVGFNATAQRVAALNDLELNPFGDYPAVLAIAPYFGRTYGPDDLPPNVPAYPTLDELLELVSPQTIDALRPFIADHKDIANEQGFRLVCYEGGQHFAADGAAEGNHVIVQLLHEANRDPRMGTRYGEYLDMLKAEGVETVAHYSFCRAFSQTGSWSILERIDQPLAEAPKYAAIRDWMAIN